MKMPLKAFSQLTKGVRKFFFCLGVREYKKVGNRWRKLFFQSIEIIFLTGELSLSSKIKYFLHFEVCRYSIVFDYKVLDEY